MGNSRWKDAGMAKTRLIHRLTGFPVNMVPVCGAPIPLTKSGQQESGNALTLFTKNAISPAERIQDINTDGDCQEP